MLVHVGGIVTGYVILVGDEISWVALISFKYYVNCRIVLKVDATVKQLEWRVRIQRWRTLHLSISESRPTNKDTCNEHVTQTSPEKERFKVIFVYFCIVG